MQLKELLQGVEVADYNADYDMEISGISYDSRKTGRGDLFVAISGFETDGHRYIPDALEKGASVIVCEKKPSFRCSYVLVADCRESLAIISVNFFGHPATRMKIIGITGTNGKTTSSYLIKHILEKCTGDKVGLIGTINNLIGDQVLQSDHTTPESYELQRLLLQMYDSGCRYVVMEVSSHSLKLNRVYGIQFDVAEFTNLTQDHLDFHHSMEDYAHSKKKLFFSCRSACMNKDDPSFTYFEEDVACPISTYSVTDMTADYYASDIVSSEKGVDFKVWHGGHSQNVYLPIPGSFSVYNALGAIAVASALGIPVAEAASALYSSCGVKGRLEVLPTNTEYSVLIDYAHTPDALKNVLSTLKPLTKGRLITLFGCGGDRDHTKRPIMGAVAAELSDFCIITSDNPRSEDPESIIADIMEGWKNQTTPHRVITNRLEAIHWAIDNALNGDVILLAGKGHEDYQVIGHEKHHFDEREIVLSYLERKRP